MRLSIHRRAAGLAAVLVVVACSCTGVASTNDGSSPQHLEGGTLRVGVCCLASDQVRQPDFLDPQIPFSRAGAQREFLRCCLARTLLSYTGRSTNEGGTILHPDLATGLPDVSDDALTWTFHLKRGIPYGPPLEHVEITTPDIVRALERTATLDIGTEEYVGVYSAIEGVREFADGQASTISGLETPDPYTLRVHLNEVISDLGYRFALPATAPIPPSPADPSARFGVATGHETGYGSFLISSGPYMIEGSPALDPSLPVDEQAPVSGLAHAGGTLTLVRNPSWSRGTDDLREAYVDRIEVRTVKVGTATRLIESGSLDLLLDGQPSPAQIERYENDPDLRDRLFSERCNFVTFSPMRLTAPPFDDIHVRRAANYAFDGEEAARIASEHRWGSLGFVRFLPLTHLAPDSTEAGLLADWDPYPYDLERAREEMALSRYDSDGDGVCDDRSCRGILTLETNSGPEPLLDRVWQEGFGAIGLRLDIHRLPFGRVVKEMSDPRSPATFTLAPYWEAEFPSPSPLFGSAFGSVGLGAAGTAPNFSLCGASESQLAAWGYSGTSAPSVDAKIGECEGRIEPAQQQCWAELDQLLMLQVVPAIPYLGLDEIRIVSERVTRYSVDQPFGAVPALDQIDVSGPDA
jgi:peptide/nickel transport system substrate-binding protein